MAYRITSEAKAAGVDGLLSWVLAALFGGATALLNSVIYLSEYRDGSHLTEQIDAHATGLSSVDTAKQILASQTTILDRDITRRRAEADLVHVGLRHRAITDIEGSTHDRAILYARSVHQGTGTSGTLPPPKISFAELDGCKLELNTKGA